MSNDGGTQRPRTVLVVDDHPQARAGVVEVLREAYPELRVDAVDTAEAALERFATEPPELVLLDYRLPGSDAVDVLRRMGELSPQARLVVLTGDPNRAVADAVRQAGASDCLGKSTDIAALFAIVREIADGP